MRRPQVRLLPNGRLHLQDGPIDLIVEARGEAEALRLAYEAAVRRFTGLLDELCAELPGLRAETDPVFCQLAGRVARRMHRAVAPFAAETFITPMAAVAGAVAEEILGAMMDAAPLRRAAVNNGGDIALHLGQATTFRIGLVDRPDRPSLFGHVDLDAASPVRGIATSGRRGRSFSLGIADAVTILARTAAVADAAATVVANAVDLPGHPAVVRRPASDLQPDNDLGPRLVTRDVGALSRDDIAVALDAGESRAEDLLRRGLILGAALRLQDVTRAVGPVRHPAIGSGPGGCDVPPAGRAADLTLSPRLRSATMPAKIRKIVTLVEEVRSEVGRAVDPPTRRAAAIAVIANPFAGRYVEDLSDLMAIGSELGGLLAARAVAALGIAGDTAESYGKAALVGEDGELEHAAAILHPSMGGPVRAAVGRGAALIPSAKKRGGPGATLDVPLGHKDAAFVRSHFDAMEVRVADAPRAGEILVVIAITDSGRPLPRVGGLAKQDIKGEDGLR